MKRVRFVVMMLSLLIIGCSQEPNVKVLVEQDLIHLHNGTPEIVKKYFQEKIQLGDGGLHTYHLDNKTYLMLFEPNRMISQIQEFSNEVRVNTVFNDGPGTFKPNNEVNSVLYIKVINRVEKPFTVIKEKDTNS
ncbi:hypothetical protein [Bacillus sp. CHD6a]|uniref:hypothetical protein n=1 Tax=Bacillus sp. CHD6a TaxID=1643452 RepID=UPI0006CD2170|nr:hypothetical protein [Bacillus sp. CHD6a]KPB03126.1 hypothetical protein AAV98_18915 [Bacillus sp. CHD6a]